MRQDSKASLNTKDRRAPHASLNLIDRLNLHVIKSLRAEASSVVQETSATQLCSPVNSTKENDITQPHKSKGLSNTVSLKHFRLEVGETLKPECETNEGLATVPSKSSLLDKRLQQMVKQSAQLSKSEDVDTLN